jgi:hypothetical protein
MARPVEICGAIDVVAEEALIVYEEPVEQQ